MITRIVFCLFLFSVIKLLNHMKAKSLTTRAVPVCAKFYATDQTGESPRPGYDAPIDSVYIGSHNINCNRRPCDYRNCSCFVILVLLT